MKKNSVLAFLYVTFIGVYLLNFFTPLMSDDIYYMKIVGTDEPVNNLADMTESMVLYYFVWGGRVLAQIIGQLFLFAPKVVFNVFNAIVFILFIVGIYLNVNEKLRREKECLTLLSVLLVFWLGIPRFAETGFWLMGAVNYLWTTTIVLYFVYYFKKQLAISIEQQTDIMTWKNKLVCIAFGFVAGWTNENTALGVLLSLVLCILMAKKKYSLTNVSSRIKTLMWSFGVGAFVLISAPGNYLRSYVITTSIYANTMFYGRNRIWGTITTAVKGMKFRDPEDIPYDSDKVYAKKELWEQLNYYFETLEKLFKASWFIWVILIVLLIILYVKLGRVGLRDVIREYYLEMFIAIFTLGAMISSPYFPLRATFGVFAFLIVLIINLFLKATENVVDFKKYTITMVVVMLLSYTATFMNFYYMSNEYVDEPEKEQIRKEQKIIPEDGELLGRRAENDNLILLINLFTGKIKEMRDEDGANDKYFK